jgi:hypothetical protein
MTPYNLVDKYYLHLQSKTFLPMFRLATYLISWTTWQHKLSLKEAVRTYRIVRRRGSHIFSRQSAHRWRWGCQSYATASSLLPPGWFLVFMYVRGWVDYRVIVRLEGLSQLRNPVSSLGLEHTTSTNYACSSEISIIIYEATRCHNPKDNIPHSQCHENSRISSIIQRLPYLYVMAEALRFRIVLSHKCVYILHQKYIIR